MKRRYSCLAVLALLAAGNALAGLGEDVAEAGETTGNAASKE